LKQYYHFFMTTRTLLTTGSVFMAFAVAFGAFGAHVVQDRLTAERFDVYQTAVQYHFYHALGLLIVGTVSLWMKESVWLKRSGYFLTAGILIFSGSLYFLTLTDTGWLGMITPIGGFAFILGWLFFAVAIIKQQDDP
jgi:uncharacterized membrane protein YgdD (TMEM256/DUF423 family)